MKTTSSRDIAYLVLVTGFCFISYLLVREFFAQDLGGVTGEIISAVVGSVIIVTSVAITIHYQSMAETEREFQTQVFAKKIELYKELLDAIFAMDDDNLIERQEVQDVENMVGSIALVASDELVHALSRFILQLKIYGALYPRSLTVVQLRHLLEHLGQPGFALRPTGFDPSAAARATEIEDQRDLAAGLWITPDNLIALMRNDLAVVEGEIFADIEAFVKIPYDRYRMVKDPNVVD